MGKSKRLNRDHAKKTQRPMVEDRVIAEHLTALLTPTIKSQSRYFRELGLRDRILTLPLMVAAVLTLLWRDVPGASCRGEASDLVKYFANPDIQKCLGIVKRKRKPKSKLIVAPFPDKQRGSDQFFFQFPPKSPLTTSLQA